MVNFVLKYRWRGLFAPNDPYRQSPGQVQVNQSNSKIDIFAQKLLNLSEASFNNNKKPTVAIFLTNP